MNYTGYFQDNEGNKYYPNIKAIKIPSNADLNNYKTEGMYYNSLNSEVATILNVPQSEAFSLLVEKHAGYKQTFTIYNKNNPKTWIRNFYSGSWGQWFSVFPENGASGYEGWTKFADGTMICYNRRISCPANTNYSDIVFPVEFTSVPSIILTNQYSNSRYIFWTVGNPSKTGFRAYPMLNNGTLPNLEATASYIAIGFWK